jgi:uncharacterized protein YjbI with pentapeptide repeats
MSRLNSCHYGYGISCNCLLACPLLQAGHVRGAILRAGFEGNWNRLSMDEPVRKQALAATLELHRRWVQSNGTEGECLDLSRAMLIAAKFEGADLWSANFQNADLTGANLAEATLDTANLWRASLQRAHLMGANLNTANLRGVNFMDAVMSPRSRQTLLGAQGQLDIRSLFRPAT